MNWIRIAFLVSQVASLDSTPGNVIPLYEISELASLEKCRKKCYNQLSIYILLYYLIQNIIIKTVAIFELMNKKVH